MDLVSYAKLSVGNCVLPYMIIFNSKTPSRAGLQTALFYLFSCGYRGIDVFEPVYAHIHRLDSGYFGIHLHILFSAQI